MGASGQWEVRPVLRVGADGINAFNALAIQCFERQPTCPVDKSATGGAGTVGASNGQLAVVVDGQVLVAPAIYVASFDRDQITISSNLTEATAQQLTAMLESGELPARLDLPEK